mgnify:FL=1
MAIPTLAMIPSGYKAGKLYSVLPSDGTGDFTVARNSIATRVNQSGLIEEVGVNVPRLDYSAGGCPVLLTEIQSQNLIDYSEDFTTNWTASGVSVTANQIISPNGNLTGSLIQSTTANVSFIEPSNSPLIIGNTYTYSVFVKKGNNQWIRLAHISSSATGCWFDLENGVVGTVNSQSATIDKYENDWYRISNTFIATSVSTSNSAFIGICDDNGSTSAGAIGQNFYVYGAQVEQQPAATSYIKTTGTPQTREADLVNGAGSAATFNSLEHTFFVDLNSVFKSGAGSTICIVGSTGTVADNRIMIQKQSNDTQVTLQIRSGGSTVATETLSNIDFSLKQKLAITVKENEVKYYRNGFLIATDTGTIPLPVSLGQLTLTSGITISRFFADTKDIRYYNQVLTAAETLELMSYDSFNEMASALQYTIK